MTPLHLARTGLPRVPHQRLRLMVCTVCMLVCLPFHARAEELVGYKMIYAIIAGSAQRKLFGEPLPAGCQPLTVKEQGAGFLAHASGNFCLTADLEDAAPAAPMLAIDAPDVSVDLLKHMLIGKTEAARGLWFGGRSDGPGAFIRVRNGTIVTQKQPAVFMEAALKSGPTVAAGDTYPNTGFVLENLVLHASEVAVIMKGRNNVIRRCKILGGNGTVQLQGPGLVFEDNEIVLNAGQVGANGAAPVALYLEDADGAIVRNNRFTIRGDVAGAQAIVLKNSANVQLHANHVNGGKQSYQLLDQQSSVRAEPLAK